MDFIVLYLIFGIFGLGLETIFTAAVDYFRFKDRSLKGHSSLWYLPLYGCSPIILCFLYPRISIFPWHLRGGIYMILFFAAEYLAMWLLRKLLGESPSEKSYFRSRWHIRGLIRLDYAPAWFLMGLLLETLFRILNPAY